MTEDEKKAFNEANKKIHKVEDQWHYPIVSKYGYIALDKTGIGFVRSYRYEHPDTKHRITVSTGYSCDHWKDEETKDWGYHSSLDRHLEERVTKNEKMEWERVCRTT